MYELKDLKIDEEIRTVIPPLDETEFRQLKENILNDGTVYEPIVVWNGFIIDGHHRFQILTEHPELKYAVEEMLFSDKYSAMAWACTKQLGRRNLSDFQKTALLGRKYNLEKLSCGEQKKKDYLRPQNEGVSGSSATARKIALEFGVSKSTVERAAEFVNGLDVADELCPGIANDILSGKIKTTQTAVSEIGKVPADKRGTLLNLLKKPKKVLTDEDKQNLIKRKQSHESFEMLDKTHANSNKPASSAEGMISCFQSDTQTAIYNLSSYFKNYPEILTMPKYKIKVDKAMLSLKAFADKYLYWSEVGSSTEGFADALISQNNERSDA